MSELIALFLLAVLFGYLEQYIYRSGFANKGTLLFGWLTPEYHLPLGIIWFSLCYLAGNWWFFPVFCVVQDASWFAFHPDTLDRDDWVTAGFGGFKVFGQFIPY